MAGTSKIMAGTSKKIFSVSEVLSMLDLDDTQSGSDLDINDLYDESDSDMSDLGDENVAMEKPHEEHVPIEEHMESNEPVCQSRRKKRRRHPEPIVREWLEIPDMKNDKQPTLLDYDKIGGPTKDMAADATAVDYFDLFFLADDGTTLWDILVLETNKYQKR